MEGSIVGHLLLEPGKHKITAQTLLRFFVPADSEHRLSAHQLQPLARCPHCQGFLEIIGTGVAGGDKPEGKQAKALTREEAKANAVAAARKMTSGPRGQRIVEPVTRHLEGTGDMAIRIAIGKTTIEIE